MAPKRYYLSDRKHEYILRMFRKARELSWFQPEESDQGVYWYADIDFENIPEKDTQVLGDESESFLERLKREVRTERPAPSEVPRPDPPSPSLAMGTTRKKKKKGKVLRFILSTGLICVIVILMTAYHVNAPSEIRDTLKKDFMALLQKSVKKTPSPVMPETGITDLLNQCQKHLRAKRLTTGEKGTALNCYREVLRLDPDNAEALAGLQNIEMQYVLWASKAMRAGNFEKVRQYLKGLSLVNPDSPDLADFRQELAELDPVPEQESETDTMLASETEDDESETGEPETPDKPALVSEQREIKESVSDHAEPKESVSDHAEPKESVSDHAEPKESVSEIRVSDNRSDDSSDSSSDNTAETSDNKTEKPDSEVIAKLLNQCQAHLKAYRFTSGKGGTALECYKEVLAKDPDNAEAYAGLQKMEMQYVLWTKRAMRGRNLKKVRQYLEGLEKINPESPDLNRLEKQLARLEGRSSKKLKKRRSESSATTRGKKTRNTEDLTQISLGTGFNQESDNR